MGWHIIGALAMCMFFHTASGQFYITGTTFLDSTRRAPFTNLLLHSSGIIYQSGSAGDFGIPSRFKVDTITAWTEGYDSLTKTVFHGTTNLIRLKPNAETQKQEWEKGKLSNLIPNLIREDEYHYYRASGETYPILVENKWVKTNDFPKTGISPTGNKASYANLRRFIKSGNKANQHAIRIEELVNYFMLACTAPPTDGNTFSLETRITDCPWNPEAKILSINSVSRTLDFSNIPPANMVFLIDNSGSMDMPNRLPLLKSAFSMLVKTLRDIDRVAIVTYGGYAGIHLPPTHGNFKDSILAAIDAIEAGGATSGSSGIHLAYELATVNPIPGANNRVILATDGDFNVGLVTEKELEELIIRHRKTGVSLTCLGVGMGNLKESKIETLARHGNGNYAYLDDEQEAEKVMVLEFSQNMYSVATNFTIELDLNPQMIKSYKLIGYENRLGAITSNLARLVGGEIGAGFPLNIFVEVNLNETGNAFITKNYNQSLGAVNFKFHDIRTLKNDKTELKKEIPLNYTPLSETERNLRISLAASYLGNILKNKDLQTEEHFENLLKLATASIQPQIVAQEEFLKLIVDCKRMYLPAKTPASKPTLKMLKKNKS